jgi:hypothetical protein
LEGEIDYTASTNKLIVEIFQIILEIDVAKISLLGAVFRGSSEAMAPRAIDRLYLRRIWTSGEGATSVNFLTTLKLCTPTYIQVNKPSAPRSKTQAMGSEWIEFPFARQICEATESASVTQDLRATTR